MELHQPSHSETVKQALTAICEPCDDRNCTSCKIYRFCLHIGFDPNLEIAKGTIDLPDRFAFQTMINKETCGLIYYAQIEDNQYMISLPKIGEICRFSIKEMQERILQNKFVMLEES